MRAERIPQIVFIGDYLPRRCGIATFTSDLRNAVQERMEETRCVVAAVTDIPEGYTYPDEVILELVEQDERSYLQAADYINSSGTGLVSLQHEFGIYGGPDGSHVLSLLEHLRVPVVTTLHTVLENPLEGQREVLKEIGRLSARMVVMSHKAKQILLDRYGFEAGNIEVIFHGIPDMPFVDPAFYKDSLGVEGRRVILTFGLLSRNKGLEFVIRALPEVTHRFPDVVYIILGATHPNVLRTEGEAYRTGLRKLASDLGVSGSVIFRNRFVATAELMEYIGLADVYITPYLNREQITSGTLSYAFGCGKAVVSTRYWHAEELLDEDRGLLVPFRDSTAIADALVDLLSDEQKRNAMRKRAYLMGREMTWKAVADEYSRVFNEARDRKRPGSATNDRRKTARPFHYPDVNIGHLIHLTDSTGLFQHAKYSFPNRFHGYCTDDNARALLLLTFLEDCCVKDLGNSGLYAGYASFLHYAFDPSSGRFHNFMSFDRRWLDGTGSDDCQGRALHALGTIIGRTRHQDLLLWAFRAFSRVLPALLETPHPRAMAYAALGITEYLSRYSGDLSVRTGARTFGKRLLELFREGSGPGWPWFESSLTYSNAVLPHALLALGRVLGERDFLDAGLAALDWLMDIQTAPEGHFRPVGSDGFYPRGGVRAVWDQQPIDAASSTGACCEAWDITHDLRWKKEAEKSFEWFLGRNDLVEPVVDPLSGSCSDGLQANGLNRNRGAEAVICWLQALVDIRRMKDLPVRVLPFNQGDAGRSRRGEPAGLAGSNGNRTRPARPVADPDIQENIS